MRYVVQVHHTRDYSEDGKTFLKSRINRPVGVIEVKSRKEADELCALLSNWGWTSDYRAHACASIYDTNGRPFYCDFEQIISSARILEEGMPEKAIAYDDE